VSQVTVRKVRRGRFRLLALTLEAGTQKRVPQLADRHGNALQSEGARRAGGLELDVPQILWRVLRNRLAASRPA
jgi:hypothetical protein